MMKSIYFVLIIITAGMLFSCKPKDTNTMSANTDNPLLQPYDTPYGVPPFDKIKNEHFKPALEESMAIHKREIDAIASNTEEPTFENTIEALDKAGEVFARVSNTFYNLSAAHTNDVIKAVEQEMAPVIAQHYDYIRLNETLFDRVKNVYDKKNTLNLNEEQTKLLEDTYKAFIRNGALLKGKDRETISRINEELSSLTVTFGQNVMNEVNSFEMWVDKEEDLSGLPEGVKAAAAEAAKNKGKEGQWLFTLQNPSVMPFLQYADNRDLRKKIWEGMSQKGAN